MRSDHLDEVMIKAETEDRLMVDAGSAQGRHTPQTRLTVVPGWSETGPPLGAALLAHMVGLALIGTLFPFQFDWPIHWLMTYGWDRMDVAANVLLFLPLGFFFCMARWNAPRQSALSVLWIGALMSLGIESAQLFLAERVASLVDVAANATGAWMGATLFERLQSRLHLHGQRISRHALALPVMGLIYLLVPLLWLNALAAPGQPPRVYLALLLGLCGATVLGGIQRHHFSPAGVLTPPRMAAGAMLWFLGGVFPALVVQPQEFGVAAMAVGILTWWYGSRPLSLSSTDRRFEVPVLQRAVPVYAVYLMLLALIPLIDRTGTWNLSLGFPVVVTKGTSIENLHFLEQAAACLLLGYMVAEWRGRAVRSFRAALPRVMRWGVTIVLVLEGMEGWRADHGASIASALVLLAAVVSGAWLYYLQLTPTDRRLT